MEIERNRAPKRYSRYPWTKWFKREGKFTLTRGVDFPETVQAYSMAQMVRNKASKLKIHAKTKVLSDKVVEILICRKGRQSLSE